MNAPIPPFEGVRALVPRARHQSAKLAGLLESAGVEPICEPAIQISPPTEITALEHALASLAEYDCLVLTSPNGVSRFFAQLTDAMIENLPDTIIAIGPATAESLRQHNAPPTLTAERSHGEGLAEAIVSHYQAQTDAPRILLARAEVARSVLPEKLRAAGMRVDDVPSYRTTLVNPAAQARLRAIITAQKTDAIIFTSPSTAKNLFDVVGLPPRAPEWSALVRISIGPVTSRALQELGIPAHREAQAPKPEALVEALKSHYIDKA